MHATVFALKRAFQSALRVVYPLATHFGITPARFDLLYCVHLHDRQIFRQSDLRRTLGVSAPTVSRMLKSLEELDLVFRCIDPDDARQRNVGLTHKGRALIREAIDDIIEEDVPQLAIDVALGGARWFDDALCEDRTLATTALLHRIAAAFHDTGCLAYDYPRKLRPIAILLVPDAASHRRGRRRPRAPLTHLWSTAPPSAPPPPVAPPRPASP